MKPTPDDVYGVVSLMFWAVTVVVSAKYVGVVMRAENEGEGGVVALVALARRLLGERRARAVVLLGVLGASLFYGDTLITPAISVLSAVEGLEVSAPGLADVVVPIAAVILAGVFFVQRWGTGRVGALFGPVMILWFGVLAVTGVGGIARHPSVVKGLSPTYAISFVVSHPSVAFVAVGAVVLVITGAEALYADMGHFGRPPIVRAWFFAVFPALTLNYLGQAALMLEDPSARTNPFFLLLPHWARLPMVFLATAATVIASQAVISGAFSVTRQAMRLGFLPPLTVHQTSKVEGGQVYLPAVNGFLFVGVLTLMVSFGSSAHLATAYGVAVTGALLIDTVLLLVVARALWHWRTWQLVLAGVVFGGVEFAFFSGNIVKVVSGGWLPLLIAVCVFTVMTTWQSGRRIVSANRNRQEGPLRDFVEQLHADAIPRVPGTAVFLHPTKETTPLALRANVGFNGGAARPGRRRLGGLGERADRAARGPAAGRRPRLHRRRRLPSDAALRLLRGPGRPARPRRGVRHRHPGDRHRPGHGVVLPLARRPAGHRRPGHGPLAQAAVRLPGPQRRQPDGVLRPPRGPHRRDGHPHRRLTPLPP